MIQKAKLINGYREGNVHSPKPHTPEAAMIYNLNNSNVECERGTHTFERLDPNLTTGPAIFFFSFLSTDDQVSNRLGLAFADRYIRGFIRICFTKI